MLSCEETLEKRILDVLTNIEVNIKLHEILSLELDSSNCFIQEAFLYQYDISNFRNFINSTLESSHNPSYLILINSIFGAR